MATDTALLVIDMQLGNVGAAYQREAIEVRLAGLVADARGAGTPVVFIQHEDDWLRPGVPEWAFVAALTPAEGELVIRKRACDAFYGTPLREELTARGVRHLVVTGVQTELCIDATCRRAASEGFDVTLVADGHTTEDSPTLPAAQIIAHHNRTLGNLAHPDHPIAVRPCAEIAL
ncbi:MAG: cysteine hydrolase family protein [Thermomicrobiales bacterium]